MGNTNVANVEVSLSMLYSLSSVQAMMNEHGCVMDLNRWEVIRKLLEMQNITFDDDDI